MLFYLAIWITLGRLAYCQESASCCNLLPTNGSSCLLACEEVLVAGSREEQVHSLSATAQECPAELAEFWQCINSTFLVVSGGDNTWYGRSCCNTPLLNPTCETSCHRAKSRDDLDNSCHASHEAAFFDCLDKQEASMRCCGASDAPSCRALCQSILLADPPLSSSRQRSLRRLCTSQVSTCVLDFTRKAEANTDHSASLHCCDRALNSACSDACKHVLRTYTDAGRIVDELSKNCSEPEPMNPMWACFLQNSNSKPTDASIEVTGIDGAKLYCCAKASSSKCRNLCMKTYGRSWAENYDNFVGHCSSHMGEEELNLCLEDVRQPCKPGCTGLNFCTNFNDRPTELFRTCSAEADTAAEETMKKWWETGGIISLPHYMTQHIPVKDIRYCEPKMWKSIACTLQVQPCNHWSTPLKICRSDCHHVLSRCLDLSRTPEGDTVDSICSFVAAPHGDHNCLSLSKYADSSPHREHKFEVTHPCHPNPCNDSHVCEVNRRKCHHPDCKPYVCRPGCPVGEASSFIVPRGSHVRIPMSRKETGVCANVCRCGNHGLLHRCEKIRCVEPAPCYLSAVKIHNHKTAFYQGCNQCVCYGGESVCTRRECPADSEDGRRTNTYLTGLPCNCENLYEPVCASNGQTFPNRCVARCGGFQKVVSGSCSSINPCSANPCRRKQQCVIRRQVCLNNATTSCKQYECIDVENCDVHHHEPVCDIEEREANNMCELLQRGRVPLYRGHCMSGCWAQGTHVCGTDGETYPSDCAAWGAGVTVDYKGRCKAVGPLKDPGWISSRCDTVVCREIPPSAKCRPLIPPGACCPVCAGELRVLYSHQMVDQSERATGDSPLTLWQVREVIHHHVGAQQCAAFTYLSIEGDLVVLIMPVTMYPTPLQVEACMMEAENLARLVRSESPTFITHLPVSAFLHMTVRTAQTMSSAAINVITPLSKTICLLALSIHIALRSR